MRLCGDPSHVEKRQNNAEVWLVWLVWREIRVDAVQFVDQSSCHRLT
jgi:hypothetical protein